MSRDLGLEAAGLLLIDLAGTPDLLIVRHVDHQLGRVGHSRFRDAELALEIVDARGGPFRGAPLDLSAERVHHVRDREHLVLHRIEKRLGELLLVDGPLVRADRTAAGSVRRAAERRIADTFVHLLPADGHRPAADAALEQTAQEVRALVGAHDLTAAISVLPAFELRLHAVPRDLVDDREVGILAHHVLGLGAWKLAPRALARNADPLRRVPPPAAHVLLVRQDRADRAVSPSATVLAATAVVPRRRNALAVEQIRDAAIAMRAVVEHPVDAAHDLGLYLIDRPQLARMLAVLRVLFLERLEAIERASRAEAGDGPALKTAVRLVPHELEERVVDHRHRGEHRARARCVARHAGARVGHADVHSGQVSEDDPPRVAEVAREPRQVIHDHRLERRTLRRGRDIEHSAQVHAVGVSAGGRGVRELGNDLLIVPFGELSAAAKLIVDRTRVLLVG